MTDEDGKMGSLLSSLAEENEELRNQIEDYRYDYDQAAKNLATANEEIDRLKDVIRQATDEVISARKDIEDIIRVLDNTASDLGRE